MILNPCGPKNGFFYSHRWRKKWYCTFVGVQLVFFSNRWKTKWVAHLWARKWFYLFTQEKKKNDIAHLKAHKWFFWLTHEKEKNDIAHTNRNSPKCNLYLWLHATTSHLQLPLDIFAILFYVGLQLHYNQFATILVFILLCEQHLIRFSSNKNNLCPISW